MVKNQGGNLASIRKRNFELVKEVLHLYRSISRTEISDILGLTPPTITTAIGKLMKKGLVAEREYCEPQTEEKQRGRRQVKLSLAPQSRRYIGAELGPYASTICSVNLCAELIKTQKYPIASPVYSEMLQTISQELEAFIQDGDIPKSSYYGVVVSMPGYINIKEGNIRRCHRPDWNGRNFAEDLQKIIQLPVRIENNVRVRASVCEFYYFEYLHDCDTFVYYSVSAGVSSSIILKNSRLTGYAAGASEAGHMVVDSNGPVCEICGNRGCLEALASERAIVAACRTMLSVGRASLLNEICPNPDELTIQHVILAQQQGDSMAQRLVADAINNLGINLANVINLISPQVVVVDGFIFQQADLHDLMLQTVKRNLFSLSAQAVNIRFASFDPFRGANGAAVTAIREFFIKGEADD